MTGHTIADIAPRIAPDIAIDITADLCPMTFIRTRLALDRMRPGQILSVRLKGEEPRTNVPRTAAQLGHTVLSIETDGGGVTHLLVRKAELP
jgi:tRNA 2-thiouridine synthesizing protein A